ncbi:uncharacterized protein Z518_01113 [Rhinocladiella mackenziei CBS 650.93]|uniref:Uncharacterized protein n=1 Tax=Rhinocladiella mackenziei CBS 650.93 TaxID=1442369 RepID=A0A0D2G5G0_9EURO|nr:uncharacterized protein Z518_01113 [Rhinocladiella mackenziei CBS 650.93]KIX10032.1 hypothetical protein Z518_01113 [Rhinocladiella mackenziei CBS 650.93]
MPPRWNTPVEPNHVLPPSPRAPAAPTAPAAAVVKPCQTTERNKMSIQPSVSLEEDILDYQKQTQTESSIAAPRPTRARVREGKLQAQNIEDAAEHTASYSATAPFVSPATLPRRQADAKPAQMRSVLEGKGSFSSAPRVKSLNVKLEKTAFVNVHDVEQRVPPSLPIPCAAVYHTRTYAQSQAPKGVRFEMNGERDDIELEVDGGILM